MTPGAAEKSPGGKGGEGGLDFVAGVRITGFLRYDHAGGEDAPGFVGAAGLGEQLAVLKISGDVGGMVAETGTSR